MTTSIIYALACLFFTALNDFVFKLFASHGRSSRGVFISLVGVIWFLALVWLPRSADSSLSMTLSWGILSGTFSLTANILLIEAMALQSAGVCSTIYRLNMVFVVLGAALLLDEKINFIQGLGIVLALLAVLAFLPMGRAAQRGKPWGFYLALLAALLRAGMGLSYKQAFIMGADKNGIVIINSFFWIFGGLLYAVCREKNSPWKNRHVLGYGMVSGALVAGIVFFMAAALHAGEASIALPIAQMSFLGTFLLSLAFLDEPFTPRKIAALASGVVAVVLLTMGANN